MFVSICVLLLSALSFASAVPGLPSCKALSCGVADGQPCDFAGSDFSSLDVAGIPPVSGSDPHRFCGVDSVCKGASGKEVCVARPTSKPAACNTTSDCLLKSEISPSTFCKDKVCTAPQADGALCAGSDECSSQYCTSAGKKCGVPASIVNLGEDCDDAADKVCSLPFSCDQVTKKCISFTLSGAVGSACGAAIQCTDGLACVSQKCAAPPANPNTCTLLTDPGCQACSDTGSAFIPVVPSGCKALFDAVVSCAKGLTPVKARNSCLGTFAKFQLGCAPSKNLPAASLSASCNALRVVVGSASAIVPSVIAIVAMIMMAMLF